MGTLTHSKGRSITVPADAEAYYLEHGWSRGGTPPTDTDGLPEGEPTKSWKNEELVDYAKAKGIDLGSATKKDDLLAAIAEGKLVVTTPEAVVIPDGDPADTWTAEQLTALADRDGIDVAGATDATALLAAIAEGKPLER